MPLRASRLAGTAVALGWVMGARRVVLATGVLGMFAMATGRVKAVTTEVEGAGYVGDSPGTFGCGPTIRAKYAGVGAGVRVSENSSARLMGTGLTGEVAGSLQKERFRVTDCHDGCDEIRDLGRPYPTSWMGSGRAHIGYRWDSFGIEGGVGAFRGYANETAQTAGLQFFPELQLSTGIPSVVRGYLGVGSSTITTTQRPGVYLGADFAVGKGQIGGQFGIMRTGVADLFGTRLDVQGYIPVVPRLDLRLAAGISRDEEGSYIGGEGSAGVRARF